MTSQEQIARIIREFNWANYNLPELVGLSPYEADYAVDLAEEICAELNLAQAFDAATRVGATQPNGPAERPAPMLRRVDFNLDDDGPGSKEHPLS